MPATSLPIVHRAWRAMIPLGLAASVLTFPAAAQRPSVSRTEADSATRLVSADFAVEANNSGAGTWMQSTPMLGVSPTGPLSFTASLPFYYLNAGSSVDGLSSASGMGDFLAALSADFSSEENSVYLTLTAGFPTGNQSRGFGAGKVTWDITGVVGTQTGKFSPYLNAGVSNDVNVAGQAQSSGTGAGQLVPGLATGNLAHAEAGIEYDLGHAMTLTGSVYGIFQSSSSAVRRGPRGRLLNQPPGGRATAAQDARDHGLGGVLWGRVTETLDIGLWVSHSLAYANYTAVSISANLNLARLVSGKSPP